MVRRKKPVPEVNELAATIESCAVSYSISDHRLGMGRLDDEALIEITARIEAIGVKHASLVGSPISVTLGCSRSYNTEELDPYNGLPSLFSVSFKKDFCGSLVYLPSHVFWGLRPMLTEGLLRILKITYGKPRYGSADLITLAFE